MDRVWQRERCFRILVLSVVAVVAMACTVPLALAQCTDTWTGAGGSSDWANGTNWSTGLIPGPGDSACIQISVAVSSSNNGIIAADLTLGSSSSLTLPTIPFTNNGLTIDGSSIANNGQLIIPFDTGTNTGTVLALNSGGIVTLSGTGSVVMSNGSAITGSGPGATLKNQSTIMGGGGILNDIVLSNTSTGVVNASVANTPFIVGRFIGTGTNAGMLEATNGGQMQIGSVALNNVGGTIQAVGTGSSVSFQSQGAGGQTITGGTFKTSSGGVINAYNSTTIDGTSGNTVSNRGTLLLPDVFNNPGASFQGTVNNSGSIQIVSAGNSVGLSIPSGQTFTLMGSGSLTMGDGTSNSYNNQPYISGATLVNQQTIKGTGNILNLTGFTNSGTINANVPTGPNNLVLQLGRAGASTNTGTIEATNGAVLLIGSTTINNVGGTITASGTNSNVSLVGSLGTSGLTITGGTLNGSGGGVIYGQGGSLLDGTTSTVTNAGMTILKDGQSLQAQGTLNNTGTIQILGPTDGQTFLQLPDGHDLTLTGAGSVVMGDGTDNSYNNNAAIGNNLGTSGTFDNQSTIEGTGGMVLTGNVVNDGTMLANVPAGSSGLMLYVDRDGNIQNNGTIHATNSGVFYIGGGSCCGNPFSNAGTIIADANSTVDLEYANPFGNLSAGVFTNGSYIVTGTLRIPGNIDTNAASITLNGAASQILNPSTDALAGFLTNAQGASFAIGFGRGFTSSGTFTNKGAVKIGRGSTFTVGSGGSYIQNGGQTSVDGQLALSAADESDATSNTSAAAVRIARGSLIGNRGTIAASVVSAGTVMPADSATTAGKLSIRGSYSQSATGAFNANIAGASSGQFSVLNVGNSASLNGALNIKLLNNFVPLIGATFEILQARSVGGTFPTVTGSSINSNEHFTVTYNSNNVTLTVVSGP